MVGTNPPGDSVEEAKAELIFEGGQTPADRGLVKTELARRTRGAARMKDDQEHLDVIPIHRSLSFYAFSHRQYVAYRIEGTNRREGTWTDESS